MIDSSRVDFRNPENFFHDVNSVAGLLKQFFRDLPDSLFTTEHYSEFIECARELGNRHSLPPPLLPLGSPTLKIESKRYFSGVEDDMQRRDSLHAIINSLPDPNYATLRAIILVR